MWELRCRSSPEAATDSESMAAIPKENHWTTSVSWNMQPNNTVDVQKV